MKPKVTDLDKLFKKGLLSNPFPVVGFDPYFDEHNKKFWMLSVYGRTRIYRTSITPTMWRKYKLQSKADVLNMIKRL